MGDRFKELSTFAVVAQKGSLSAAAKLEGVAPAVIGRRLDALESRLGVKLLSRTTRRLQLTSEGTAFLEDCQRILGDLANAEAAVSAGGMRANGFLRISAPAGFGRRHVAPLVPRFIAAHPGVSMSLDLTDRLVDLVNEGIDCAVRLGDLPDSSLVAVKLADNRRVVVASPEYLATHGVPRTPAELANHDCLTFGAYGNQQRGWLFSFPGRRTGERESAYVKVGGSLDSNDGAVLHEWALAGCGLAWRSLWEVGADIKARRLVTVLDDFAAPPNAIYAVFPHRKHLPLRVRLWVDLLQSTYGALDYWRDSRLD